LHVTEDAVQVETLPPVLAGVALPPKGVVRNDAPTENNPPVVERLL
jgi:hypothetical protein